MRKLVPVILGSMLLATPAFASDNSRGEAELERAIAGRVAGEPVNCISLRGSTSSQIIDGTAIVYRIGSTVYVNRPRSGAESLDRDDTMINRFFGDSRLCNTDAVRTVDLHSGFMTGVVLLGDFVPYRRPRY